MKKINQDRKIAIEHVSIDLLQSASYNPRRWDAQAIADLKDSITKFGIVDPLLVNSAPERRGIVIGGHFRLSVIKELGITEVPVVYINIPDIEKEKELNIRLNKNTGEWDFDLLAKFDETFLSGAGFSSEDLDEIFAIEETPEQFDLEKELKKLNIDNIDIKKGDVYDLNGSRMMCGDSTIEADTLKLMEGHKADMCFTNPPYILNYLKGKKKKDGAITGFGNKRDRRYLETESLPDNFSDLS